MNLLKQSSSSRIICGSATALLCVLLGSAMAPKAASTGVLKAKPSVELQVSKTLLTYPCQPDWHSSSRSCPSTTDLQVVLTAVARDLNKQTVFAYAASGGRIVGEGSKVTWDLSEAGPGIYAATVEVQDNKKHRAVSTVNVTVQLCGDCVDEWPCPVILVTCYDQVTAGTPVTCKVVVGASSRSNPITYEWSARDSSGGDLAERISRRDRYISIRTDGLGGQSVTATVKVNGLYPSCSTTAASSTVVKP